MHDSVASLEYLINDKTDRGGNTSDFLSAILDQENFDLENVRGNLLSCGPYVSDTILKAYFNRSDIPMSYKKEMQDINGPVSPKVWEVLSSQSMTSGMRDTLAAVQSRNYLSPLNDLKVRYIYYGHELQDLYFEKLDRFLNDSGNVRLDSAIILLSEARVPNSDLMLLDIYKSKGETTLFNELLSTIESKGGVFADYIWLKSLLWDVTEDTEEYDEVKEDEGILEQVSVYAYSNSYLLEGTARTLLRYVWDSIIPEEKPVPGSGGGGLRPSITNESKVITLANSVKLYPNPTADVLYIEMNNNDVTVLKITSINGQLLITKDLTSKERSVKTSDLPNGVYLASIYNGNTFITTKKIVIVR